MRFKKALSLLPALAIAGGLLALPATSARAASAPVTASLPLSDLYQVVADSAQGYLFYSEGKPLGGTGTAADSILVTNLDGKTVTTITGMTGVKGLALSPDNSTLYAALSGSDEIVAISTSTLKVTATYSIDGYQPWNLTFEDGVLWIGYWNGNVGSGGIGDIDPAAASPAFTDQAVPVTTYYAPSISGDPTNASASSTTGTVVAASAYASPTQIVTFDISGSDVTSDNYVTTDSNNCQPEYALAVLPGGSQFIEDCSGSINVYDVTDPSGSPTASYDASGAGSFSASPNGSVALGGGYDEATWDADVYTYPPGSTTASPSQGYSGFGDTYSTVAGMAWSADSSELFSVITRTNSSGTVTGYELQTLYPPTPYLQPFPLTLSTSTSTVGYNGKVNLTVQLGIMHDSTMQTVNVYETPAGGTRKLLKTLSIGSGNGAAFTTGDLPVGTSFSAAIANSDTYYGAVTTPAKTVNVYASVWAGLGNYYSSKSSGGDNYRLFHRTTSLKDSTSVTPNKHGECVKLEYQRDTSSGWKAWTTTRCSYLNSSSKATITAGLGGETVGSKYRVRVDYVRSSTDTANLSAQSGWQYFIVEK